MGRGLLRGRSGAALAASRRVVVATEDGAGRVRRQFPGVRPEVVAWEDDSVLPPMEKRGGSERVRIVVVGAIGVEKGYDVLLECGRDARRRELPLEFVVCGFTEDDERLMAAGAVFVTGRYAPGEAVALIRSQGADLAFLPSVWPEVWCYALSRAWQAGLAAVSFDLGAQAARIRATGRGAVLPLALPAAGVNDALVRLARLLAPRQSPQPSREND
jgi:glycosyltransferase involved in cell wall biosynthesis